jgi:hypothetical protein
VRLVVVEETPVEVRRFPSLAVKDAVADPAEEAADLLLA